MIESGIDVPGALDAGALRPSTPGSRVYIVDDDSMVRRSLSFSLRTLGYQTRAFATGADFLNEADLLAPGCVLLDIRMPHVDGLAVLEALGAQVQRFAVVAMTGHGDVDTAVRAMKRGARDFLEKPFSDDLLAEILGALLCELPIQAEAEAKRKEATARIALLSPREHDVLRGLVAGQSNKAVAHRLGIGIRTVEMHRGKLMSRLGVKSLAEAVRIAVAAAVEATPAAAGGLPTGGDPAVRLP